MVLPVHFVQPNCVDGTSARWLWTLLLTCIKVFSDWQQRQLATMWKVTTFRLTLCVLLTSLLGLSQCWPAIPMGASLKNLKSTNMKPNEEHFDPALSKGMLHTYHGFQEPAARSNLPNQPLPESSGRKQALYLHSFPKQSLDEFTQLLRNQLLSPEYIWMDKLGPRKVMDGQFGEWEREIAYDSTEGSAGNLKSNDDVLMQRKVGRKYNTQGW